MSRKIESIEELHAYALRMLKFMDDVCRENGLTYFLSGGSVIGAVRHQGFIPWDDDADVMLPRADYERFLDVMERRAAEGRDAPYKVGSVRNRADWSFPFARIWDDSTRVVYHNLNEAPTGIFIDVYPMDGLPDGLRRTKLHYLRVKLLHACLFASIRKRFKPGERFVPLKKLLAVFMRKIGPRRICMRIDRIAAKRPFDSANYVGCAVLAHYMARERFPRRAFNRGVYMPFEDVQLPVPNDSHAYLSALYGDYMQFPDEAARAVGHQMDVYVK